MHRQLAADRFPPGTGPRSWRGRRVSLKCRDPPKGTGRRSKKKDCLESFYSLVSLHTSLSSGAGYCDFLRILRCTSLIQKRGSYFASPARRKPRQERCWHAGEADISLWSSCGWVGTDTSTGLLGARFRLIGAVSVAAPMSFSVEDDVEPHRTTERTALGGQLLRWHEQSSIVSPVDATPIRPADASSLSFRVSHPETQRGTISRHYSNPDWCCSFFLWPEPVAFRRVYGPDWCCSNAQLGTWYSLYGCV